MPVRHECPPPSRRSKVGVSAQASFQDGSKEAPRSQICRHPLRNKDLVNLKPSGSGSGRQHIHPGFCSKKEISPVLKEQKNLNGFQK